MHVDWSIELLNHSGIKIDFMCTLLMTSVKVKWITLNVLVRMRLLSTIKTFNQIACTPGNSYEIPYNARHEIPISMNRKKFAPELVQKLGPYSVSYFYKLHSIQYIMHICEPECRVQGVES